ncbi:MAG: hypothetical protein HY720_07335 [Planctomycetes bacterium]|nr:hypothetical protein [Planctomycetota bacterium]
MPRHVVASIFLFLFALPLTGAQDPGEEEKPPDPNPATATPDEDVKEGIVFLNEIRIRLGHLPVDYEPTSSAAAKKHGQYLARHGIRYAHEEDRKHRDFDEAADRAAKDSVISWGPETCQGGCENLLNTFIHRIPLLEPSLAAVGLARVGPIVLYEYRSGLTRKPDSFQWTEPILYPADGWEGIPVSWTGESPTYYDFNPARGGSPITATFPPGTRVTEATFRLLADPDGKRVPREVHLWTPEKPALSMWPDNMNTVCAIPRSRMAHSVAYSCELACKVNGEPKVYLWSFRTEEAPRRGQ